MARRAYPMPDGFTSFPLARSYPCKCGSTVDKAVPAGVHIADAVCEACGRYSRHLGRQYKYLLAEYLKRLQGPRGDEGGEDKGGSSAKA